jgi:hypothetical protein
MATRITDAMLVAVAGRPDSAESVRRVRDILKAAGVTDVELHPVEIERVRQLRTEQALCATMADAILAAGPLPPCTCTLDDSGLVAKVNGCPLGHKKGLFPDEVK